MDFVSGWTIMQTLGEGAYGEVKLLMNKSDGTAVAMKLINIAEHPEAKENIQKEIAIHKMLNNPNIIRYYGQRTEGSIGYIFLEYAPGGELFDRIDPDVGMEPCEAQKYMKQLISGVEYLHSKGIVHRDIKPENLLLDEQDNLKITDFGMATVFRSRGKERYLDKKCGTTPYMAPEILIRPYKAEPVDVWSCGIVLVAMLAGELPWEKPVPQCVEFAIWKGNSMWMSRSPWNKLDNLAITLLRKILHPSPSLRYTIAKIKDHRWCKKQHSTKGPSVQQSTTPPYKRLRSDDPSPPSNYDPRLCQSQPEVLQSNVNYGSLPDPNEPVLFSFSQPAQIDDMLVSTQYLATQSSTTSQDTMQKLVRRMTRFFVSVDPEKAVERISQTLDDIGLSWRTHTPGIITITTVDNHKKQLTFKVTILCMDKQTLVDFRLSKGCGLSFKRQFCIIKKHLSDIVAKGPVSWPIAIATNNVPK